MPSDTPTAETCRWCGDDAELVTNGGAKSHLTSGPNGEVLEVPYGEVCRDCFDGIIDQWTSTASLNRPVTAYGGASA